MIRRSLQTLLPLFPLLPLFVLGGCDVDGKEGPDGDAMELVDEDEDEGEDGGEEMPGSREGEVCGDSVRIQPCSDEDDVLGEEICFPPEIWGDDPVWSACQIDDCPIVGAEQACGEEDEGVQYCWQTGSGSLRWGQCLTDPLCVPGESKSCGLDPEIFGDMSAPCVLGAYGEPHLQEGSCDTPLVLSFDGREPAFASPPPAARAFDISGAGACLSPDWPTAATPWLALDRDQSGTIDGGHELFGNGTRLGSGRRAEQGFEALSELDSDGDGRITPADASWSELVLWADHDGDRRSSGWELLPLESYGVEAIELDYRRAATCDERGNCGIERASFTFRDQGRVRSGEVVDVYVACGE